MHSWLGKYKIHVNVFHCVKIERSLEKPRHFSGPSCLGFLYEQTGQVTVRTTLYDPVVRQTPASLSRTAAVNVSLFWKLEVNFDLELTETAEQKTEQTMKVVFVYRMKAEAISIHGIC